MAYTESLQVNAGNSPVTFGFLDTMSGAASLMSEGNAVTVNGLDGAASVQSHGGAIQVRTDKSRLYPSSTCTPTYTQHVSQDTCVIKCIGHVLLCIFEADWSFSTQVMVVCCRRQFTFLMLVWLIVCLDKGFQSSQAAIALQTYAYM